MHCDEMKRFPEDECKRLVRYVKMFKNKRTNVDKDDDFGSQANHEPPRDAKLSSNLGRLQPSFGSPESLLDDSGEGQPTPSWGWGKVIFLLINIL